MLARAFASYGSGAVRATETVSVPNQWTGTLGSGRPSRSTGGFARGRWSVAW
jgi:hypothetical protein